MATELYIAIAVVWAAVCACLICLVPPFLDRKMDEWLSKKNGKTK